jgi:uncharacterized caspase-like protein
MARELEKLGFRVTVLIDKTRQEMSEAIGQFIDRLDSGEVNAEAGVLFYAGHGVQIDGENYLLPVDCSPRNVVSLINSSLSLDTVIRQLERTRKAGLLFLDCCRNNPFPSPTRSLGGLAKIDAPAGIFIAFATAPGAVALDGENTVNSPFTSSLVTHLPTAGISVSQMMIRVRRDVFQRSNGQQMPWDSSSLLVDFAFKPTSARALQPTTLSPEELQARRREEAATREAESWELTRQSNSEQLLRSFLTQYPYSRHRGEVVRKLRWLRLKNRVFWSSAAAAAMVVLICLFGVVQWFRFERTTMQDVDLIGGDIGVTLADLKINPVDTTLAWCRLRCIINVFGCKAYTYNHARKRCFIKEDFLFMDAGQGAKGATSAYLWGHKPPEMTPFNIYWDQVFEGGEAITKDGEPAPVASADPNEKVLNALYNTWGFEVEQIVGKWRGNAGIVCQRLCYQQPKCVAYTFNTIYGRCKLFGSVLTDETGPKIRTVPRQGQPDRTSRLPLNIPLVISGARK